MDENILHIHKQLGKDIGFKKDINMLWQKQAQNLDIWRATVLELEKLNNNGKIDTTMVNKYWYGFS